MNIHSFPRPIRVLLERFLKFATVGMISTLTSLSANFILLKYFETPLIPTYVSVYLSVILLSYILNTRYTFKARIVWKDLVFYYLIYFTSMGIGVCLLTLYRWLLPFENWVLPFLVFPFTMLWNFIFVSRLLKKRIN
jgi:putative flippase GtrA